MNIYTLKRSRDFEKSFKRLSRGNIKERVRGTLGEIIDFLTVGRVLPEKYRDHKLHGVFDGYRECHVQGDLLLIYQIRHKEMILVLVNIGSHSYLFE